MKYITLFETSTAYNAATLDLPNVSLTVDNNTVHYRPMQNSYDFDDILYSDANGNLSVSSEVLPTSEGKIPIALCVIPTHFLSNPSENIDNADKARWMSLKYMNYTTPEIGSLTSQSMYWGNYKTNISTINDITTSYNGSSNSGGYLIDFGTTSTPQIPSLFTASNEWNLSVLGSVNAYVVTDIDGKNKTDKILATATAQSEWRTDTSITNSSGANYAPAACCCARYHTLGTKAGDWYLGASGEMSLFLAKINDIKTKLTAINNVYPSYCISSLTDSYYWTSTEYDRGDAYIVNTSIGSVGNSYKNSSRHVIAMLAW